MADSKAKLNFDKLFHKYPQLNEKDKEILDSYFNEGEVKKKLNKIQQKRRSLQKCLLVFFLVCVAIVGFFAYFKGVNGLNESLPTIRNIIIGVGIFTFILYQGYIVYNNKTTIKKDILPGLVKKIDSNMRYSEDKSLYVADSLQEVIKTGLMEKYDRLGKQEDSISLQIPGDTEENGIEIQGKEILTSEKRTYRDKNGNTKTKYVTNNHLYILRVKFKDAKYEVKEGIRLIQDKADKTFKKHIPSLITVGVLAQFTYVMLNDFSKRLDCGSFCQYVNSVGMGNKMFFIVSLLALIYYLVYLFYTSSINKNRVKLENIDFEKKFDVISDDEIESRKLLTPSFMYRIVDYVNKISDKRVYEFYFKGDTFYVKYDLLATPMVYDYMEFNWLASISSNVKHFLEFYLEIKNIKELVEDLKLFYYSKGTYNNIGNTKNIAYNTEK